MLVVVEIGILVAEIIVKLGSEVGAIEINCVVV
jgi:hypothetical protein